jgi:DNA helicase-2/ATP-dependent DNA helicase PcrA
MSDAAEPPVLLHGTVDLCDVLGVPFSDEQLDIVTAPLRPGVVVAGAGSGKTTVMTARVVWLVGTAQVLPSQVLGLTFTNKAAGELAGRVRVALDRLATATGTGRLAEELGEPTVSTYHAYAGALLTEHGLRLGYEPDLRVVSDATRFQLAARVVSRCSSPVEHVSSHLPTVIESLLELDAQAQDHLVSIDELREHDHHMREQLSQLPPGRGGRPLQTVTDALSTTRARDELLDLVRAYRALKAAEGVAEFSDQMAAGARLATECPEVGAVERERFRAVLLDEYQDTSVSQRLMLQGLFSGGPGRPGRGHAVTAVGDPCQGIYGWRGASVDNIDDFVEHFPLRDGSPADTFSLRVNRRCARRILDAANSLAGPLYDIHKGAEPLARARTHPPAGSTSPCTRRSWRRSPGCLGGGPDARRAQPHRLGRRVVGHRGARPQPSGARRAGRRLSARRGTSRGGRALRLAEPAGGRRRGGDPAGHLRPHRQRGPAAAAHRSAVADRGA